MGRIARNPVTLHICIPRAKFPFRFYSAYPINNIYYHFHHPICMSYVKPPLYSYYQNPLGGVPIKWALEFGNDFGTWFMSDYITFICNCFHVPTNFIPILWQGQSMAFQWWKWNRKNFRLEMKMEGEGIRRQDSDGLEMRMTLAVMVMVTVALS